jgi:hypothetical protein
MEEFPRHKCLYIHLTSEFRSRIRYSPKAEGQPPMHFEGFSTAAKYYLTIGSRL